MILSQLTTFIEAIETIETSECILFSCNILVGVERSLELFGGQLGILGGNSPLPFPNN